MFSIEKVMNFKMLDNSFSTILVGLVGLLPPVVIPDDFELLCDVSFVFRLFDCSSDSSIMFIEVFVRADFAGVKVNGVLASVRVLFAGVPWMLLPVEASQSITTFSKTKVSRIYCSVTFFVKVSFLSYSWNTSVKSGRTVRSL